MIESPILSDKKAKNAFDFYRNSFFAINDIF